jgi:hypothetical protein
MIRISRNKIVTYIMAVAIIVSSIFPNVAFAQTNDKKIFSDINGHWAEDTIIKHAKKGMLKGYPDGTFKPDRGMKRCELISVINRYFGLKNKSNDNYNDINEKAWYAEDTAKAKYYHYVKGLTAEPNKEATRDDVIGMFALILDMEEQSKTNKSITYSDIENLEEENRNNINEFSKMGYVQGYPDGKFKPNKVINRAEILAITEAVLGYIVTSQEDLKNIPKDTKKITIINPDITIENLETEADIYISAGVNGKLNIKDSKLKGKVEIEGGTEKNPIQLENVEVGKLIITKAKEKPTINMVSTNVKEIKVKSEATINTDKKSVIKKADIRSKSNWTGQGKIQKAYVQTKDVTIEKKPQYVEVSDKKISVTIGKKDITYKTDDKRPYSGGSSSNSQTPTKINLSKVEITGQTKQGETLTANISPTGATATYKWQREETVGTYVDIAGATASTYTLTADDVDKNISVVATGTGSYNGQITSQPVGVILTNDPIALKIKDGWIPVVSKEELKKIKSNTDKTFGLGTKYEDTYTGGMDKKYMLIADIDLTGENFEPIGYDTERPTAFTGKFTGEGYTISNLTIERDEEYQGFFSKLGQGAEITHVNIDTVKMKTSSYSGVLAGESNGARIADSQIKHVTYDLFPGIVVTDRNDFATNKKSAIGGYVGGSISTVFENLLVEDFNMEPRSNNNRNSLAEGIGGLAGMVNGGTVKGCTVKDITLRAEFMPYVDQAYSFMLAGGLIGQLNNSTTDLLEIVDNKVENIDMKINGIQLAFGGRENSGGLIGEINNSSSGIAINGDIRISDCQVTGEIQGGDRFTGTSCVGGLIGTVDGTGTPLGKIEISNSNTSVRMYDFLKDISYLDIALQKCGVGGFAGRLKNVKIDNCYAIGDVGKFGDWNPNTDSGNKIDGFAPLGGFAGCIEDSYIEDSYATGDICGAMRSGGFASITINSDINRCYATGNLESKTGIWIGGFIGWVRDGVSIQDSYAIGNINNCDMECGNFIGLVSVGLELRDVYGAGKVTIKTGSDGSFIGSGNCELNITNSFYNQTGNEALVPIGYKVNTSLKAKTTDELKQIATFTGWDISEVGSGQNTVWLIEEGVTYPYLNHSYIPVISTACDVTSWNTPSNPTIGNKVGTDIRKTVDNGTTELTIDVNVSNKATWKLYSDSGCSSEIGDKRLTIAVGANTAYLKVTAEDGSTNKVYTLTITRESATLSTVCDVTTWNTPSNPTIGNKVGTDIRKTVDNETTEITIDVAVSQNATWKLYSDNGCSSEIGNKKLTLNEGDNTVYLKVIAQDGSTNKVYTITITRESVVKVTSITVTGQGNATAITDNGGTLQISAEVLPSNAENKGVTWSVSDENTATISNTGLLTAVDNGTVTVTATAKDGSGVDGQLEITINGQSHLPALGTRVEKDSSGQYVVATNQSSSSNPIGLWRIEDLVAIGNDTASLSEDYVLMNDLDFNNRDSYRNPDDTSIDADGDSDSSETIYDELKQSGNTDVGFKSIGKDGSPFTGNFNGGGYKIENLYINRSSEDDIGLFGKTKTTVIKNIGIKNCKVTGNAGVGGLVGWNSEGAIVSNSYSTGNIEGKGYCVGGLMGENDEKISNCYSTANVKGRNSLGGLIGCNFNGQVSNSYSTGNVIGISTEIGLVGLGGLIGNNGNDKVENCIAFNCSLSHTSDYVSRVVGAGGGTLTNNYANSSMTVTASGSAIAISGGATDNEKGADITAEQFKDSSSSNSPYNQWDFTPDIDNTGTEKDNDGYYWQMGIDRPILYWFNGTEGVQIGDDNGRR